MKIDRTPAAGFLDPASRSPKGANSSGSHTRPRAPGREQAGQSAQATVERRRSRESKSPEQALREAQDFLTDRQIGPII